MGTGRVIALSLALLAGTGGLAAAGNGTGERGPVPITEPVAGLKQTILQRFDVPGTAYETILMRVEFPPGYEAARHAHPGPEASFVYQGEVTFHFDGQDPQTYTAGQSLEVPAYAIHSAKAGPEGFVLINSFILEKGKPMVIPADDVERVRAQ